MENPSTELFFPLQSLLSSQNIFNAVSHHLGGKLDPSLIYQWFHELYMYVVEDPGLGGIPETVRFSAREEGERWFLEITFDTGQTMTVQGVVEEMEPVAVVSGEDAFRKASQVYSKIVGHLMKKMGDKDRGNLVLNEIPTEANNFLKDEDGAVRGTFSKRTEDGTQTYAYSISLNNKTLNTEIFPTNESV